jgi:hypothetical protein
MQGLFTLPFVLLNKPLCREKHKQLISVSIKKKPSRSISNENQNKEKEKKIHTAAAIFLKP